MPIVGILADRNREYSGSLAFPTSSLDWKRFWKEVWKLGCCDLVPCFGNPDAFALLLILALCGDAHHVGGTPYGFKG